MEELIVTVNKQLASIQETAAMFETYPQAAEAC